MADLRDQQTSPARVSSLPQLRSGFPPARDLWPDIEQRITSDPASSQVGAPIRVVHHWPPRWARVAAAAVVLVGVGIWIGHEAPTPSVVRHASEGAVFPPALASACVTDAQYRRERTALLSAPEQGLPGLPPDSRVKVVASLETIHDAVRDIETALARDSTNPLLQELLLTTCRDEIRVLTEVQGAGAAERAGRGI